MVTLNESYVIGSESILSLYPILIKLIPTTLPTQIFSRLLTFSIGGAVFASKSDFDNTFGNPRLAAISIAIGLLTCAHIYASYVAFSSLSTGVAMSLFYTYPIWNLVIGKIFFNETIHPNIYGYMLSGIIGTFLLSTKGINDEINGVSKNSYGVIIGVIAALGAAVTESIMYFSVKGNKDSTPWSSMIQLYGGALICMIIPVLLKIIPIDFSWKKWLPIVAFNVLVGFTGYALRFYTIPKVSVEVFGLLSYTGVISSFIFGYLFVGEKPSILTLIGSGLIAYAASRIESVKDAAK